MRRPGGGVDFKYNQIWSDEAIQHKERADADAIVVAIGTRLLADDSVEARTLVLFLQELYEAGSGAGAPTAMDLGKTWMVCSNLTEKDPDSPLSKTFKELNGAWLPTDAG